MPTVASQLDSKNDPEEILQKKRIASETCFSELIYKAAKNPNKKEAKIAISKILPFASIDVFHHVTSEAAVSKLAAEGDFESVNFLRKEFNASLLWIAYGYAQGKHVAEANKALELAHNPVDRLSLLQEMASAYAHGGHVAEANKVLALAENPDERRVLLQDMACGYAHGGHVAEANKVLELVHNSVDRLSLLQEMACGYAQGGHIVEANEILALAEDPTERFSLLQEMACGYAQGGYEAEANKVLALEQNFDDRFELLQQMAYGYALGGHGAEANKILVLADPDERFSLLQEMACGYAQGGHVAKANKVLELAENPDDRFELLRHMALGYALGGHVAEANKVLVLAENPVDRLALLKTIATNLLHMTLSTERDALQTLATFNPDFQSVIASELKKYAAKIDIVHLVPKATKLHTLMQTQKLNFNQAMGWMQPEMQLWLLQGPQLIKNKKLAAAMFLSVSTYLTSNSIPEMADLANKLSVTTCRDRFFNDLQSRSHLLAYDLTAEPTKNAPVAPAA
ncbi:photosystem I assembly protein Ycf3 [Legionella steelei]|uniref:Photosystem I assembly protein Ycf3 n=1 Tax=Legionella steelei TaxID=947033 RepID=A0A0W0ZHY8_9GAMM|nr:hypothetical protein [Legionella steelei]KTD68602.1 photosystem I assembly protein Ycf3 [Legionella steelei]